MPSHVSTNTASHESESSLLFNFWLAHETVVNFDIYVGASSRSRWVDKPED